MCNTGWGFTPFEWSEASLAPNNNIIGTDPLVDPENGYQLEPNSPAIGYGVSTLQPNNIDNYGSQITNYELKQNFPNPFNPVTRINYTSAPLSVNQLVEIVVHNSIGQQVWSSGNLPFSIQHSPLYFDGSNFNSGIYYYSLVVDGKWIETKSMILIK